MILRIPCQDLTSSGLAHFSYITLNMVLQSGCSRAAETARFSI
jgi:hypothetical protein